MKLPRRKFLHLAAGTAALPAISRVARAQAYPARPVHLIEGFGAGGAADIVARLIGQSLSERLGQSVIVENRAGASSNIAAEAVVRASPDGYTLLLITTANTLNTTLFKLNFNLIRDIAPVASIVRVPYVMEVHPSVPAKTVAEFIAYAKAHPGKIQRQPPLGPKPARIDLPTASASASGGTLQGASYPRSNAGAKRRSLRCGVSTKHALKKPKRKRRNGRRR